MNKTKLTFILVGVLCIAGIVSCSMLTGTATSSHADWKFIQSVGGLKVSVSSPESPDFIPVYCDISGLTPATPGRTILNSGLAVKREGYKVEDKTILYWIETCLVTREHTSPVTKGVSIPDLQSGEYCFEYLNPDGSTVQVCKIPVRCRITLIIASDKTPAPVTQLKTTLSSEAKAVSAGSSAWLTWTIQNTSDQTIYLLNHFAYASRGPLLSLDFRDSTGKTETLAFNNDDAITWGTQKDKILVLKPSESFMLKARVKLYPVSGDNQEAPIKAGKYKVSARYETGIWINEMMKDNKEIFGKYNIGVKDIWSGKISTEEIELSIE